MLSKNLFWQNQSGGSQIRGKENIDLADFVRFSTGAQLICLAHYESNREKTSNFFLNNLQYNDLKKKKKTI